MDKVARALTCFTHDLLLLVKDASVDGIFPVQALELLEKAGHVVQLLEPAQNL